MKKILTTSVIILGLSLTANSNSMSQRSEVIVPQLDKKISRASFLRDKLTDNAVGYVRVPTMFGMAFSMKNKASDKVMENNVNERMVLHLKKFLQDPSLINEVLKRYISVPLEEVPIDLGKLTTIVYTSVNGPIEVMATDANKMISPMTQLFISVPVNFTSANELDQVITQLFRQDVGFKNHDGFYPFSESLTMYFDDKEGRLFISVGQKALNETQLKQTIMTLKPAKFHKMYAYENQIDLTGQNFFAWSDITGSRDMGVMILKESAPMAAQFLQNTEGFAFGVGTNAKNLGQVKFITKTNTQKVPYLKDFAKPLDFTTVGNPKNIALMTLPSKQMVIEALKSNNVMDDEDIAMIEEESMQALSFNALNLLDILGPKIIAYNDETGGNFALGIQDKEAFYNIIKKLEEKSLVSHKVERGIHELKIENPLFDLIGKVNKRSNALEQIGQEYMKAQPILAEFVAAAYGVRAFDVNFYLYWNEENNWLVFNTLPYSLLDRNKAKVSVDKWLGSQGIRSFGLVASYTGSVKNAEESWYRDYIKFMRNNYDLLGEKFDIYSMPAPSAMKFNPESRFGAHIVVDNEWVAASLDYDISPFYNFSLFANQSGFAAIAVMGGLSAFTIPAYEDYTKRTKVSEGLGLAAAAKMATTEFYVMNGQWPSNNKEAGLAEADLIRSSAVDGIEIQEGGKIYISFNNQVGYDNYLILKGMESSKTGAMSWHCLETNLAYKYLPANCRLEIQSNR